MIRRALYSLLALLGLVLALLGWLLGTTGGARWAVDQAVQRVEPLQLEVAGGSLWSGLDLWQAQWRSQAVDISVRQLSWSWSPLCLIEGNLCLRRLAAVGVDVEATGGGAAPEGEAAEPAAEVPPPPLRILLSHARIEDLRVRAPGLEVTLPRARIRARWDESGVHVADAELARLRVSVAAGTEQAPTAEAAAAEPVALPLVRLPLVVDVDNLRLVGPALELPEATHGARWIQFAGRMVDSELELDRLEVAHDRGLGRLSGDIATRDDYPLDMELDLRAEGLPEVGALQLRASLGQSVRSLAVDARVRGGVRARVEGTLAPLDPSLPYRVRVRSERLAYPLAGEALVVGEALDAEVEGDLSGYRGRAEGRLSGPEIPAATFSGRFSGDWQAVSLEPLRVQALEGEAEARGRLQFAPSLSWSAQLQLAGVDAAARWPQAPSDVTGRLTSEGRLGDEGLRLSVASEGVSGVLRGERLRLTGRVERQGDAPWQLSRVRLDSADNELTADGVIGERLDLRIRLSLPRPQALLSGAAGEVRGEVAIRGPLSGPDVQVDLQGNGLGYQDYAVSRLSLEGRLAGLGTEPGRLRLSAGGIELGEQVIDNANLLLSGTRSDHAIELRVSAPEAAGELRLEGGLSEAWGWDGRLADGLVAWDVQRWRLAEPASLTYPGGQQHVLLGAHCWRNRDAEVCVTERARLGRRGELQLVAEALPLALLRRWLPPEMTLEASADARARVSWGPDQPPVAEVRVNSPGGRLLVAGAAGADAEEVPLRYEALRIEATLDAERLRGRLELRSESVGDATVSAEVRHAEAGRPLSGQVDVGPLRLAVLEPFLPTIDVLQGRLLANGALDGSLESPSFRGQVSLEAGRFAGAEVPMRPESIEVTVDVNGQSAGVSGSFRAGEGEASIAGRLSWAPDRLEGWVELDGERLQVVYPPLATVMISPDLRLEIEGEQLSLTGRIVVPEGELTLKELPKGAVPYSSDVVVVRGPGARPKQPAETGGISVASDVEVVIGDEVTFSGMGAEGRLTGALRLRQVGVATAEASGEIRIVDAKFEAYGQELEIRRGLLLFSGPVTEPIVDIEAVRPLPEVVVGLRVSGPASRPEVRLFSEPTMPEEQILSYLITGSAYGESTPSEEAAMAQAAVALGVFGGRGVATEIARELGIKNFQMGAEGEGEQTQVTLSGYLTPNLLVKYGISVFLPQDTVTLRYNLTRNIYVEAVSGFESAVDVFYSFSF